MQAAGRRDYCRLSAKLHISSYQTVPSLVEFGSQDTMIQAGLGIHLDQPILSSAKFHFLLHNCL